MDDIRADSTRPAPFFNAARVAEMDAVREKAIAQMWHVSPNEREHAAIRIAENRMIVDWVQRRFAERYAGYQLALDRLALLAQRMAEYIGTQVAALVVSPGGTVSK